MTRALVAVSAVGALFWSEVVVACPCSSDAGSGTSLLRADERYAGSLLATSRRTLGRFDARGHYRALEGDEAETSEELLVRLALRLPRRLEWLGEIGYASYRLRATRVVEQQEGIGDVVVRARYTLWDESMPHEVPRWPALALSGLLRAPLGSLGQGRSSGFGSGGAELGLGAWEVGAGVDLSRAEWQRVDLFLGAEVAYRFEDRALSVSRQLGHRADAWLGARLRPADVLSTSLALRIRTTGNVEYDGVVLSGTGQRLLTLLLGINFFEATGGFRSSATLSLDPPLPRVSMGTPAAVALGVSLGYSAP